MQYYCLRCQQEFSGVEPISFAECGIPEPVFPLCPFALKATPHHLTATQLDRMTLQELETDPAFCQYKKIRREHKVILSAERPPAPKPVLMGQWAKPSANLTKPETEVEKASRLERERLQKQQAEAEELQRVRAQAMQDAQLLIARIDTWINSGQYKMVADRPSDYIYPRNDDECLKATPLVISYATATWNARLGRNHHVLTGPKDDWRNGRVEADFMCNNDAGGKHIAHIIQKG